MIHVDALDFSECHSEEVISFFWRSVYIAIVKDYWLYKYAVYYNFTVIYITFVQLSERWNYNFF